MSTTTKATGDTKKSPRSWAFYNEKVPHRKVPFDELTCKSIDLAFDMYTAGKGRDVVNFSGATFNFPRMTYTNQGIVCKLSSCGGVFPYKLELGKDTSGVSPCSREVLSKLDPGSIVNKWYWWDSAADVLPLSSFGSGTTTKPTWTSYAPADAKKLDQLYATDSKKAEFVPINKTFCVNFGGTHKGSPLILQGKLDEEENPDIPDDQKHRRPVLRAAYCWCYNSLFDVGKTKWVPYPPETSALLEEMFIMGFREATVTVKNMRHTLDFEAGVQYPVNNIAKRTKVARFGTDFVDSVKSRGGIHGDAPVDFPKTWENPSSRKFLCSTAISVDERFRIKRIITDATKCK